MTTETVNRLARVEKQVIHQHIAFCVSLSFAEQIDLVLKHNPKLVDEAADGEIPVRFSTT